MTDDIDVHQLLQLPAPAPTATLWWWLLSAQSVLIVKAIIKVIRRNKAFMDTCRRTTGALHSLGVAGVWVAGHLPRTVGGQYKPQARRISGFAFGVIVKRTKLFIRRRSFGCN
jgi:hypothetical protein